MYSTIFSSSSSYLASTGAPSHDSAGESRTGNEIDNRIWGAEDRGGVSTQR